MYNESSGIGVMNADYSFYGSPLLYENSSL